MFLPGRDIKDAVNPLGRSNNLTLFLLGVMWLASLLST